MELGVAPQQEPTSSTLRAWSLWAAERDRGCTAEDVCQAVEEACGNVMGWTRSQSAAGGKSCWRCRSSLRFSRS